MLTLSYLNHAKVSMPLYPAGENIDTTRSHHLAGTGKLTQLMRGIYASSDENIDEFVLKHSVRIAKYLYPRCLYLVFTIKHDPPESGFWLLRLVNKPSVCFLLYTVVCSEYHFPSYKKGADLKQVSAFFIKMKSA